MKPLKQYAQKVIAFNKQVKDNSKPSKPKKVTIDKSICVCCEGTGYAKNYGYTYIHKVMPKEKCLYCMGTGKMPIKKTPNNYDDRILGMLS